MPPLVLDLAEQYKARLFAQDQAARSYMAYRWLQVERNLLGQMFDLASRIRANGRPPTRGELRNLTRWSLLLRSAETELESYADWATGFISAQQALYARFGITAAADLIRAAGLDAGVAMEFDRLGMDAISNMAGYTVGGAPLRGLLDAIPRDPRLGDRLAQTLFNGMAQGLGPERVARLMARQGLGLAFTRAAVIARTETLRAYRQANIAQYQESGVVGSYRRLAAKSGRTCAACLALDGRVYPLTVPFADHPNGRCSPIPIIEGRQPVPYTVGPDWYATQPERIQRQILGPGHYSLYRQGMIGFDDLVSWRRSPIWGDSPQVTPLRDLYSRLGIQPQPQGP
jgi:SPP1 gp7 family putative phage head morphogenesis protein